MINPINLTLDELKDATHAASVRASAEWRDHVLAVLREPSDDFKDALRRAIWEADPDNSPYESLGPFRFSWNVADDMANAAIQAILAELESRTG